MQLPVADVEPLSVSWRGHRTDFFLRANKNRLEALELYINLYVKTVLFLFTLFLQRFESLAA